MVEVDPYGLGSLGALLLGVLMFAGGMYARRGGQLRNRQGAAVLAGMAAVIGVMVFGIGAYALLAF
jgi:NhaP-type Na+/H+ or K+/H+ antiporter